MTRLQSLATAHTITQADAQFLLVIAQQLLHREIVRRGSSDSGWNSTGNKPPFELSDVEDEHV